MNVFSRITIYRFERRRTGMKIKASVTLSEEILKEVDKVSSQYGSRSNFIEKAIRDFLAAEAKRTRDRQDSKILNRRADVLNKEASDVLFYQVGL